MYRNESGIHLLVGESTMRFQAILVDEVVDRNDVMVGMEWNI